jgi:hypothetical protein
LEGAPKRYAVRSGGAGSIVSGLLGEFGDSLLKARRHALPKRQIFDLSLANSLDGLTVTKDDLPRDRLAIRIWSLGDFFSNSGTWAKSTLIKGPVEYWRSLDVGRFRACCQLVYL